MFARLVKCSTLVVFVAVTDSFPRFKIGRAGVGLSLTTLAESHPSSYTDISGYRKEYSRKGLIEDEVSNDPSDQFRKWFNEACESNVLEPNAMVR